MPTELNPLPVSVPTLLNTILTRMQLILGDKLAGLYLYGSLVTGDYDDTVSDVDLLAAITSDLNDDEFAALDVMHDAIIVETPQWNDRIEIGYYALEGLRTFRTQSSPIAVISPGEPFNRKTAGREWLMNWYIVREWGVTLYGPPPADIIDPISQAEFVQCIREHALAWREWVKDANHRGAQAYAILTMCRALYTVATGVHPSKLQAAAWAQTLMPEWATLIQEALRWRLESREADEDAADSLPDTYRFVDAVIERIIRISPRNDNP